MKSSFLLLALLLTSLTVTSKAEDANARQLIVSLPEGGFVSFQNETAWTDLRQSFNARQPPGPFGSQALPDHDQIIHRVLRDNDGRFVFGYDLWVIGDSATRQFKVAVRPMSPEVAKMLRDKDETAANEIVFTFPKSTEPVTLTDGSEFSLDLLINKSKGVKIIDVVRVSFDRSRLGTDGILLRPRDFTLDAVSLEMKDYSLLVNDNLIASGKAKTGCANALLWIYIPHRGRFIFSLFPREGYSFQKIGTVTGNKIEFTLDGDQYQWFSSAPILREEGTWNLWVLHDTNYSPLLMVRQPPPTDKGVLDKLEDFIHDSVKKTTNMMTAKKPNPDALTVNPPLPPWPGKPAAKSRDLVMMGSADRIENLLPRQ